MRNVVLFAVILLLASCFSRQKLISRGWKINDLVFENARDSAALGFAAKVREQMLANINFTMDADSTYTIWQLKTMTATHGKWWFSADKKHIFTKTDLGLTDAEVLKLTKSELIFESKDQAGNIIRMFCVPKTTTGSK